MFTNAKPTEQVAVLGAISPSSQAVGAATSAWVSIAEFQQLLALVQTGTLGAAATVDAKLQQATDAAGTGAKDIAGKAITQIVKATGDNVFAAINLNAEELDVEGGFGYVQLSVTVGTAASETAAQVFGFVPRYAPASDFNAAAVAEIIG